MRNIDGILLLPAKRKPKSTETYKQKYIQTYIIKIHRKAQRICFKHAWAQFLEDVIDDSDVTIEPRCRNTASNGKVLVLQKREMANMLDHSQD